MTVLDDRTRAQVANQAAEEEGYWEDLVPEAVELVVAAGYGSAAMLGRKMRVGHGLASDLLAELADLGVVGSDGRALVDADGLAAILADLADDADPPDVVDAPVVVDLVKPDRPTPDADLPGTDLALRPRGELAVHPLAILVAVRQAAARHLVWVADQPVVARGGAVARQLPRATWRLAIATPRGATRAATLSAGWLRDDETRALLSRHAEAGEGDTYDRVMRAREAKDLPGRRRMVAILGGLAALVAMAWWLPVAFATTLATLAGTAGVVLAVRHHGKQLLSGLAMAVGAGWAAWHWGDDLALLVPRPPGWVWWVALGVAVVVFGWMGRHEDVPLIDMPPRMVASQAPPITAPMVIGALCAVGIAKMREPDDVRVLMDPHRAGSGVQIDLELPAGVTAAAVIEARDKLAAALRRNLGTVWPSTGPSHPGHLSLFISDQPVTETEQEPWPLTGSGPIDIFTPQPAFTDQLGNWVYLNLAYASWVIGAVPRMGKTYTVRELLLIYGMDPRVKVIALDGKGTGDLAPLAPFAHMHVRGARADNPESIEKVRAVVSWLLREMGRRTDALASLPVDEVPDSKVTSELVDAHPELDLGPIALGIDETQSFFSYGFRRNKEHKDIREEIRDGVIELMRMGPALGIWVIMATQTVRDSTIPTEAQAVAVYRYALKMEGWEPNDKVLGTGAFKSGIDATMFGFDEKGVGWLKGEGAKPLITRSVVDLDAPAARTLAVRCRAWRSARNLLTGEAGDQDGVLDAEIVIDINRDAADALVAHRRDAAQHPEMLDWLREMRPEHYAGLDLRELIARMPKGPDGQSPQVWSNRRNGRGVRLSDLRKQDAAR